MMGAGIGISSSPSSSSPPSFEAGNGGILDLSLFASLTIFSGKEHAPASLWKYTCLPNLG